MMMMMVMMWVSVRLACALWTPANRETEKPRNRDTHAPSNPETTRCQIYHCRRATTCHDVPTVRATDPSYEIALVLILHRDRFATTISQHALPSLGLHRVVTEVADKAADNRRYSPHRPAHLHDPPNHNYFHGFLPRVVRSIKFANENSFNRNFLNLVKSLTSINFLLRNSFF